MCGEAWLVRLSTSVHVLSWYLAKVIFDTFIIKTPELGHCILFPYLQEKKDSRDNIMIITHETCMSWHTTAKDSWTLPQYLLLSHERKVKHRPRYRHIFLVAAVGFISTVNPVIRTSHPFKITPWVTWKILTISNRDLEIRQGILLCHHLKAGHQPWLQGTLRLRQNLK